MNKDIIYSKILDFLSIKDRTEYEVRQRIKRYLLKSDVSRDGKDEIEQEVIDQLYELHLLDDLAYGKKFVSQKLANKKPESKSALYIFLYKKGLSKANILAALTDFSTDIELSRAKNVAISKLRGMVDMPILKQKQRLYRYLLSKRFPVSTINSVIDTLPELK